jgi:GDPmannose 4,6-dehydratase
MIRGPDNGGAVLVLGGNGQDGVYLTRALLKRARSVVAVDMQPGPREPVADPRFRYASLDLRRRDALAALLAEERPSHVFHFAAVHASASGEPYERRFGDMLDVNVASVHVVLEHLRAHGGRLLYASSIKAFGEPPPRRIDETTPRHSTCLYGVSKNAATDLILYYRRVHGVLASVVFLGNHESPLRPAEFFIPKIARSIARAKARPAVEATTVRTLDFHCDWGSAEEYADIAVDLLDRAPAEEVVMGTGRTVHARTLCSGLFASAGLDATRYLRETDGAPPADRPEPYALSPEKLERLVGRRPRRTVESVVEEIVGAVASEGA